MFTGILAGTGKVVELESKADFASIVVILPTTEERAIKLGSSIAINGVCLTVSNLLDNNLDTNRVSFDVVGETLSRSNLSFLKVGDLVNYERSLLFGDEVGGHLLSGHIDCVVKITNINRSENNYILECEFEPNWADYIFDKGYIGLEGASLTVASVKDNKFTISLIPETLRVTTFQQKKIGDILNLEIDRQTQVIVETTRRFLSQ